MLIVPKTSFGDLMLERQRLTSEFRRLHTELMKKLLRFRDFNSQARKWNEASREISILTIKLAASPFFSNLAPKEWPETMNEGRPEYLTC